VGIEPGHLFAKATSKPIPALAIQVMNSTDTVNDSSFKPKMHAPFPDFGLYTVIPLLGTGLA
jgi:hypothetical protein